MTVTNDTPNQPENENKTEKVTDSTDWKAEARKWEERAKQNRDELATAQQQLKEMGNPKSDLEKALERLSDLEAKNTALEQANLRNQVAAAKGVNADLLQGSTAAELEANADALLAWRGEQPRKPAAPLAGLQPENKQDSDTRVLLRNLLNKE